MTDHSEIIIRKARLGDLEELLYIYNHEVVNGTATFDIEPKKLDEWQLWFDCHNVDNHPLIAAECGGHAVGYASLSPYRSKEAYAATVELSIYIHPEYRRRGIASMLMRDIIEIAKNDERTHIIVAVITAENEASISLHERFGFKFNGLIPEVGVKFGRYLGIVNYSLTV